jgi:hypothetical protein
MGSTTRPAVLERSSPAAFIGEWARELGASSDAITKLGGGINNDVYRIETNKQKYILKVYSILHAGSRDRLRAEIEFLQYANSVASDFVPRLIEFDADKRAVLMEFVEGHTFSEGALLSEKQVSEAVRFFAILNQNPEVAKSILSMDAAEGFLKITDHLENVAARISTMTTSHLSEAMTRTAGPLLDRLKADYEEVKAQTIVAIARGDVVNAIDPGQRYISASDFGFHNAIQTETGIKFIDFEFAGWDDPAKASLDFVLQPRVPVRASEMRLLECLDHELNTQSRKRVHVLGPILHLKWLCIILALLDGGRFNRFKKHRTSDQTEHLIEKQLTIASNYFDRKVSLGLH